MQKNIFTIPSIFILSIFLNSCIATYSGIDKQKGTSMLHERYVSKENRPSIKIFLDNNVIRNGKEQQMPKRIRNMELNLAKNTYMESEYFASVSTSMQDKTDLIAKIEVIHNENISYGKNILFGATLGLIPLKTTTKTLTINTILADGSGRVINKRSTEASINYWQHIFLVFGAFTFDPVTVERKVMRMMHNKILNELFLMKMAR